jgi:PKD repeat protein
VDSNGDGNFTNDEDGYGNITIYAYDKKGFFEVTLKVTDEGELNRTDNVTVWIWNYLPVANITADNTTVYENDTVYFNASDSYDPDGLSDLLTFLWDFDDGTPPILTSWPVTEVDHSFNESRIFNVTLTVTDGNLTYNITWIYINVLSNAQPTAVIDEPTDFEVFSVNETIVFNASSSSDPNDEILEYWWDFGDGTNTSWSTNPFANHSYSDVGTGIPGFLYYTVTLDVRDNEGLEDTEIVTINVNNFPPVAIANSNVTKAPTNQSIEFDGSESYDPPPGNAAITYFWDFDDGNTASDQIVEHDFTENGTYNVTLTVTDIDGENDTDWIIINITNRDPVIEFVTIYPDPATIVDVIYINITAYDPDGGIVNYTWDFGDGNSYYETPDDHGDNDAFDGKTTHTYTEKNTYLVLIAVYDDDGNYSTTQFDIIIENIPPEVEITDPPDDDTVSGTVTISGTASDMDDQKVSYVEIRIDDSEWFQPDDTSSDSSWSTWSYDWDTESGPYQVINGMHTIYARSFDEEDTESDPWAEISVDVDNIPSDIFITENLDKTTVEAGGTIDVSGQVTYNTGDPVDGAQVDIEFLTFDNVWTAETSSSGHYTMNITAPEEDGSFIVRVTAEEGSFSDSEDVRVNVTLIIQPDLGIATADIDFNPSTPDTGDIVIITITVWNYGKEDADDVLVSVYDGDPDDQGIQIDRRTINDISKESEEEIEIEWDTEDEYGLHQIHVVIDPADKINESDENNNEAQRAIDIEGQPDFAMGGISFSAEEPKIGDSVTIQVTIYNNGTESDTVDYKIFDGDPDLDIVIGEGNKQISADRSSTVSVDWIPDEGGEHVIYVVLDPDDDITESDEDNNEGSRIITVEKPAEDGGIPPWLIPLTAIIALIVIIILFMLNYRGKKKGPEKDLPVAQVVKKETKPPVQEAAKEKEKEEEEQESLIDTHGGIRIG